MQMAILEKEIIYNTIYIKFVAKKKKTIKKWRWKSRNERLNKNKRANKIKEELKIFYRNPFLPKGNKSCTNKKYFALGTGQYRTQI